MSRMKMMKKRSSNRFADCLKRLFLPSSTGFFSVDPFSPIKKCLHFQFYIFFQQSSLVVYSRIIDEQQQLNQTSQKKEEDEIH